MKIAWIYLDTDHFSYIHGTQSNAFDIGRPLSILRPPTRVSLASNIANVNSSLTMRASVKIYYRTFFRISILPSNGGHCEMCSP